MKYYNWLAFDNAGLGSRPQRSAHIAHARRYVEKASLARKRRGGDAEGGGGSTDRWTAAMIPMPTGVRVWLATGYRREPTALSTLCLT
jgi:hypothetical protein